RAHRRDVVSDSLFTIDAHRLVVTNTFAVGKPIDDGAVLRARDDRVSRWLAMHADAVQPLLEKVKKATDRKLDAFDAELASAAAQVPQWKREGKNAFEEHVDALQKRMEKAEEELKKSDKAAEAKKLRQKFERWLDDEKDLHL